MAAGPFTFFNAFRETLGNAFISLDTGPFRMTLHAAGYTPSAADDVTFADTGDELATANGYTAGGAAMTVAWTRSGSTCSFTCDPVSWPATGSGLTARLAVVHADLPSGGKPLVGWFLLDSSGAAITVTAGNTLVITPHASGLFTLA